MTRGALERQKKAIRDAYFQFVTVFLRPVTEEVAVRGRPPRQPGAGIDRQLVLLV
jgi:hypothetical protein